MSSWVLSLRRLSACVVLAGLLLPTSWCETLAPDDQLVIPPENLFDGFQIEGINDVQLYPAFPEDWPTVSLAGTWKKELLLAAKPAGPDPLKEAVDGEADTGDGAAAKEAPFTVQGNRPAELTRKFLESMTTKLTDPQAAAKSAWKEGETLPDGRYLFLAQFVIDKEAAPPARSCILDLGMAGTCYVYVNGDKAAEHESSWVPFTVDITRHVKAGPNTVALSTFSGCLSPGATIRQPGPVYARRLLLQTDTTRNLLTIDAVLLNTTAGEAAVESQARVTPYGRQDVAASATRTWKLPPGETPISWEIPIEKPVTWSPENPFLYELRISDARRNTLGKERFGFRSFEVRGTRFYLNGEPYMLLGCQWNSFNYHSKSTAFLDPLKPGEPALTANKRYHYAYLRALKAAGVNCVRLHSDTGFRGKDVFEACDEVGILHYSDWHTSNALLNAKTESPEQNMAPDLRRFEEWLYFQYNHPSTVMISLGNERYGAQPENLNCLYDHIHRLDRQNRPICSSSGRIRVQLNVGNPVKDKLDFADDHSYYGTMRGPWMANRWYFRRLKQDLEKVYGADKMPIVNFECIASPTFRYENTKLSARANRVVTAEKTDKAGFLGLVQMEKEWGWEVVMRFAFCQEGLRTRYTDEVGAYEFAAETNRRQIELFRQENILQGIGGHTMPGFIQYAFGNQNSLAYVKQSVPSLKVTRVGMDITRKEFVRTPGFYMMKRYYNPEFISARWFDRNLIAGSGAIQTEVHAINDSSQSRAYTARLIFRSPDKAVLHGQTLDFGRIDGHQRKTAEFRYPLPGDLKTGSYRLELFLFGDGRRVSDNFYEVFVIRAEDARCELKTDRKVALYEAKKEDRKPTTSSILDRAKLTYDRIEDIATLANYQVLILGSDSVDERMLRDGERVRKWVEAGGRLLSFDQHRPGFLPWISEMSLVAADPMEYVDLADPNHPALAGLTPKNFDTWNGNGLPYTFIITPLDETAVAIGPSGYVMSSGFLQTILADVSLGQGMTVLSQFDVTSRYGQDAVATLLTHNILRYILSDEKSFSSPVRGRKVAVLDPEECVSIDLKPYLNSSFIDEVANDGKGGWDDHGPDNDLRDMAVGKQSLAGVPFEIIDPRKNNDRSCIILRHPRVPRLPKTVEGIKVNDTFASLYFLHTATYCGRGQKAQAYEFIIHYLDGKEERVPILRGIHICDWTAPRTPLADSTLAWTGTSPNHPSVGVFYTQWKNPRPDAEIATIDFSTEGDVVAVLIAITGHKRTREERWQ